MRSTLPNQNDPVDVFPNRFAVILEVWCIALPLTSLAAFPWHVIGLWLLAFAHEWGEGNVFCIQRMCCGPCCADCRAICNCRELAAAVQRAIPKPVFTVI